MSYFPQRSRINNSRIERTAVAFLLLLLLASPSRAQKPKLPKPRDLDRNIQLLRDPTTGEMIAPSNHSPTTEPPSSNSPASSATIVSTVSVVVATCSATSKVGAPLRDLVAPDFRAAVDGSPQSIATFDTAKLPLHIVLVIDSSPSEAWSLEQSKNAARALAARLDSLDEVAVVSFAGHAHLLLPFTTDRAALEAVLGRIGLMRSEMEIGSNIYSALYLSANELFADPQTRSGPHAVVLLTDGQDSGLGLSWNPVSMQPAPGSNKLAFEDVVGELSYLGVEVFAISTENRPNGMTPTWLAAHSATTLIANTSRRLEIPSYTIYLAELVRRTGGELDFLRELGNLSDAYARIAATLRAEYTLGFYPAASGSQPGWHRLSIAFSNPQAHLGAQLNCRSSYFIPRRQLANLTRPANQ